MEQCVGLLLMLYNSDVDMCFCILVCHKVMAAWKNIHVNQNYKFSDLKVGILQTSSGGKIFLLKTTDTSTFSYMDSLQVKKFYMEESLKSLISVPGINRLVTNLSPVASSLVSYQGLLTKLKNLEIGIYELDSKVLLYTTFNASCKKLTLESEVIVSNAHLIRDFMGTPILVCCGSSCVKNSKPSDVNDESLSVPNDTYFVNFCIQYGLNIFDILWFERLFSRLKKKLSSLIADEEVFYKLDSNFLKNVLEFFLCVEYETTNKKLSLVEEFFSCPHQCFPFSESRLPTGCRVPYLLDIVDEVIKNASWIDAGPSWKFCVGSQDNSVVIGILYISNNGNFYIVDGTFKLPVIFAEDCDACCHNQNIIQELKSSKYAFVVAVQEYDVIVENIICKNGIQQSIRYLRTSLCRLYPLLSLCKSATTNSFAAMYFSSEAEKVVENINLSTSQKFSCESEKDAENVIDFHSNLTEEMTRRFLVLSKIWTLQNKVASCTRVLILLLSENSQKIIDLSKGNESILEDTFNFYDSGDDAEFANLISELDFLHIGEKETDMGYLCFDATIQDSIVFPGHIYAVAPKDRSVNFNLTYDDNIHRLFTWTVNQDIKLIHDPVCIGNHCIEDYENADCHGIKEILLKRQLNRNWIVTCILQDKTYEDVKKINEGKSGNQSTATLCMTVRDCNSEESSIKVYVPYFSGNLYGLLPGAPLQLFGFLCFCSQNGILYLKASSVFGILVKQPKALTEKCRSNNFPKVQSGNSFHCPVQSLCFVVKITFAEIFLTCSKCWRSFPKRCSCYSQQKIKLKLSALIDDGNQLLLAHCHDETAKKILNIDSKEWQAMVSYVEVSHQFLKFSDKAFWSKSALLPVMNQVFNTYCLSKATSRPLMFEYTPIPRPYSCPGNVPSVWCKNATDVDCQKHMKDLYLKFINNVHNLSEE
ncbi:unnamed protein product [Larinioides sclopetarius]